MSMYIWKVELETEWKYVVKAGTKVVRSYTDTDSSEEFNVAAPSGLQAIEKAKNIWTKQDVLDFCNQVVDNAKR